MMTNHDYEAIAQILTVSVPLFGGTANERSTARAFRDRIAWDLADYFQSDNPKFDRKKFLDAAGVLDL